MNITINCSRCKGTGKIKMNGAFADTFALLKKQREELNGATLAKLAGIKATAMNNRLVWLESVGLVASRQYGRQRLWRARR